MDVNFRVAGKLTMVISFMVVLTVSEDEESLVGMFCFGEDGQELVGVVCVEPVSDTI